MRFMASQTPPSPPRPIAAGDIVATFSDHLAEWTAAQITDVDADSEIVAVLDLDWSGPEPRSAADLGEVRALQLTHHSHSARLSHCYMEWVLPRSYKVVGTLPLVETKKCNSYSRGWRVGFQLAMQRRWDQGDESKWSDPHKAAHTGLEFAAILASPVAPESDSALRRLSMSQFESLDCDQLVQRYPNLTRLTLSGAPSSLSQVSSLNRLASLKNLVIHDLFGMTASDCLRPQDVPNLESLTLQSIPVDYAEAMRAAWQPEVAHGTFLEIRAARRPGWFEENLTNPLRDWDDSEHIEESTYLEVMALYRHTQHSVLALLSGAPTDDLPSQMFKLGQHYGERLNELDEEDGFIDTIAREELFDALEFLISAAEASLGGDLAWAYTQLTDGAESVRDW